MSDDPIDQVWPCDQAEWKPGRFYPWTDAEVDLLFRVYVPEGIRACMARLPGRSQGAILNQVAKMGLRRQKEHAQAQPHNPMLDAAIGRIYTEHARDAHSGEVKALAKRWNVTRQYISRRAQMLGFRPPLRTAIQMRAAWTAEEDAIIERSAQFSPESIAVRLKKAGFKRTPAAVCERRRKLEWDGLHDDPDTLSAQMLSRLMGADTKKIARWIESGQLKARRYRDGIEKSFWRIKRKDVREFLLRNAEWDHRRCDRDWLIEILSGHSGPRTNMKEVG